MAYEIKKVDVWAGTMTDRPGGLGRILGALSDAGADLEFVIARRQPDKPGTGVVFLAPLRGPAQLRAAKTARLAKAKTMHSLRVQGPDKPGLGAKITAALAEADVNMRGLSAASMGKKNVVYFAFDSGTDAAKAARILKKTLATKKKARK